MVGRGARVLIENAMTWHRIPPDPARTTDLVKHFLDYYEANIAVTSRPFEGMELTVRSLASRERIIEAVGRHDGFCEHLVVQHVNVNTTCSSCVSCIAVHGLAVYVLSVFI
jgi:phosphoglycolate phosphatase-like HAD superfamily hydrolase